MAPVVCTGAANTAKLSERRMTMRRSLIGLAAILGVSAIIGAIGPSLTWTPAEKRPAAAYLDLVSRINHLHSDASADLPAGWRRRPIAQVVIAVTGVDPTKRALQASATLQLYDPDVKDVEFVDDQGMPVLDDGFRVRDAFRSAKIMLRIDVPFVGEAIADFSTDLLTAGALSQTAALSIPADSNPQSFPADRYRSRASIYLDLPPNMHIAIGPRGAKDRPTYDTMLVVGRAAHDEHLTQWNINSATAIDVTEYGAPDAPVLLSHVEITLHRPITLLFFYWSLAFAPALLGCVYLWSWEVSRRTGTPEQGSALELGAALLALLTIREVLVPPDIPGLTLLDRVLGVQLVMIVCALTVALVRRPVAPADPHPWVAFSTKEDAARRHSRSFPRRRTP